MYENTGRLFKNDKKEPGDKRPDYTGDFTDAGKKMRLAAWLKDSNQGGKWMSLKVSEMQEQQPEPATPPTGGGDISDEVPFAPETR
jgi:hypothetical protein